MKHILPATGSVAIPQQIINLQNGNNIELLKKMSDNCIDSIVTDPPYGLSFMNKKWDYDVPSVEFWKEVYRVLKPGGHVLSFGGTRTYHRMVINIEDAGFEIRDQIQWIYGSGFPKSLNIGKQVDKKLGNEREVIGIKEGKINLKNNNKGDSSMYDSAWLNKEYINIEETKGNSPQEGWGTGLKPANEPICLARKPISEKTITDNVLKWGTGGINIDGCRIELNGDNTSRKVTESPGTLNGFLGGGFAKKGYKIGTGDNNWEKGRFPSNVILDENAAELLDNYKKFFYIPKVSKKERNMGLDGFEVKINIGTIKLLIYKRKNEILWERQDLNQTHQVDTEQSHQKDTEEFTTKEECVWNTELFGNYIMEKFQKDIKSITEMKTNSITIYQTLNSLIQKSTKEYIAAQQKELMGGIKFVESADKKNTKAIITYQKKDGSNQSVSPVSLKEVWSISAEEEVKSNHPTMKPVQLMSYLVKLITPPNGIVLDPFMGSGSTGIATLLNGYHFFGMEMDNEYFKIAEARINNYEKYREFIKK